MKYKIYKLKCKTCLYLFNRKINNIHIVIECPKCGTLNTAENMINKEIKCLHNKIIERYYLCVNMLKELI